MDKKNTMLLTVIAVATLLVAVVGATFAYFSVQGGVAGNTTAVTGEVAAAGVVTAEVGETDLVLKVSNTEMKQEFAGTKYYAVTEKSGLNNSTDDPTNHNVFKASIANAAAGETYTCKFDFAVTVTGNNNFVAGDGTLNILSTDATDGLARSYDLVNTNNGYSVDDVTWTFTGGEEKTISMNAFVQNKDDAVPGDGSGIQDSSLGLGVDNLQIQVKVTGFACDVDAA